MGETAGFLMAAQGLSAGSTVLGAASSAYSSIQQSSVDKMYGRYNEAQLKEAANDAENRGKSEALKIEGRAQRIAAEQRAAIQGGNLDPTFGTVGAVLNETDAVSAMDEMTATNNALREAYGLRKDASMARYKGDSAARASRVHAANTIATGGLQAAQDIMRGAYLYETYKKPPAGSGAELFVRPPRGKTMSDPRNR